MATPALALCTDITVPTTGEVIFITIVIVVIVDTEVVHVENVRVMAPGLGVHLSVYKVSKIYEYMITNIIIILLLLYKYYSILMFMHINDRH